jgi:hypothetical protein
MSIADLFLVKNEVIQGIRIWLTPVDIQVTLLYSIPNIRIPRSHEVGKIKES